MSYLYEVGVAPELWTATYPFGSYNDQAIEILAERGCSFALTTEVRVVDFARDTRYKLPRLDTNDFPKNRHAERNTRFFEQ